MEIKNFKTSILQEEGGNHALRISAFFGGGVLCGIAKMNSSHQSSPVSPILESTAQPAINSKIKLILKDYPGASVLSFEMNFSP